MAKKKATVIAIANQKGGTAKTTTCENLGIGLANEGKDVLLVDVDPQGSLTIALGNQMPDEMEPTLADMMERVIRDEPILPCEGVLRHPEGVDLMPGNILLSGLEASLVNVMSRETVLKQYLNTLKDRYDYILLDGSPSLGLLTINMLAAADSVLVPVQAQYLSAKGLEQLLGTVSKVRRQINPKLRIEGVLLTMVDQRTNYAKEIAELIRETYGKHIRIYESEIPRSIRAAEISAAGRSIFRHDPRGKVAEAYRNLTKEVLADGNRRLKRSKENCL
ncbi:MAG: ParA family protein [Eubacterium sp.]|nr:ParA family protein [Eubacterium sp.]